MKERKNESIQSYAKLLGVSASTLRRAILEDRLKFFRAGKRLIRISPEAQLEYEACGVASQLEGK